MLPMQIALAQQNLESAEHLLLSISNPTSPQFSQYLTAKEVGQRFAPSTEGVTEVLRWLNEAGISKSRITSSHSGGWLNFNATIMEAEQLLKTQYHIYQQSETTELRVACDKYSLPKMLQRHVDFVMPTIHLGNSLQPSLTGLKSDRRRSLFKRESAKVSDIMRASTATQSSSILSSSVPSNCWEYTQLDCLRALYNIPTSNTSHPNNSFGIFERAYISWLPGDLDFFFSLFMPSMVGQRPVMDAIDGGYYQTTYQLFPFNAEPDIDFEYAMPLVYPLNVTNYQVGDQFIDGYINNLLAALDKTYCGSLDPSVDSIYPDLTPGGYNSSDCGNHKATNVISISYGDDEVDYPLLYKQRQCLEFLKLGLQGVSIIVSSMDYGVAGEANTCIDPLTRENNASTGYFNPTFPASCPYVTSVGGTQLPINSSVSGPETTYYYLDAEGISSSGGGFSNVFPAPSHQSRAVGQYISCQHPELSNISALFNSTGRGYPDVAANAANYLTYLDGELTTLCTLSLSFPLSWIFVVSR
jgi:tripeptidyl-peptidase I